MKRGVCIALFCVFLILPIVSACGVSRPETAEATPVPTEAFPADDTIQAVAVPTPDDTPALPTVPPTPTPTPEPTEIPVTDPIITLIGGVIGIILGLAGALAVCSIMDFSPSISPGLILLTTMFSSALKGEFFGG